MNKDAVLADQFPLPKTILNLDQARGWRTRLETAKARIEWLEKVSGWYELEDVLGKEPWAGVEKISIRIAWIDSWEGDASFISLAFRDGSVWKESLGTMDDRQCLCSKGSQGGESTTLARSREAEKMLDELRAALDAVVYNEWETRLDKLGPMDMGIENFKTLMFSPEEIAAWEAEVFGAEANPSILAKRKPKGL